jgi:hypothetical protein
MTHSHDDNHEHNHTKDNHNDNGHSHDHGHSHDNADGHSHSHDHGHTHELTFEQKLEKLFGHWIDHNDSHKDTFFTWAERAKEAGLSDVAKKLDEAGQLSTQVTRQLRDAMAELKG